MELIIEALAVLWAWVFIRNFVYPYVLGIPDWLIHLTVIPGLAYLSLHAPQQYVGIAAIAGAVLVLQGFINQGIPAARAQIKRRRSNIPPPP
jgi:hypothetical protein